ncbi:MAG: hypothetical protein IKV85_06830 [Ruminococcus sp.]|nr:hypothetical protein [Ruminococcus sp.]
MQVQFTNTNKRENSTAIPSSFSVTRSCVLKNASSIINPVIELDCTVNDHTYNYCYIADFSRYYWVRDIVYEDARIIYYLDCDVLASARAFIGNASMYVLRSAADWNGDIIDTLYPTKVDHHYDRRTITSPWTVTKSGNFVNGSYVVGIRSGNGVSYYVFSHVNFALFVTDLLSDDFVTAFITEYQLQTNPNLKMLVDPLQYIDSVLWFPFAITKGAAVTQVNVGNTVLLNQTANVLGTFTSVSDYTTSLEFTVPVLSHPQAATRGQYLNNASYTDVMLACPPFGHFNIDISRITSFVSGANILGTIYIDLRTGHASLSIDIVEQGTLTNTEWDNLVYAEAQCAVSIPLSQTISQGKLSVGEELSVVSGIVSSLAKADIAGAIGTGMAAIEAEAKTHIPDLRKTGNTTSYTSLYEYYEFYINYDWLMVVDDDLSQRGRPLCEVRQLSTLAGYQLIADADIRTTLTAEEDRKIKQFLESGYFYE